MQETNAEEGRVPNGLRWRDLIGTEQEEMLDKYRGVLAGLAQNSPGTDQAVTRIFRGAKTVLRESRNLQMLTDAIDKIDWFSESRDSFGDLYEGLLQKNAEETKRGAGQYFTPRVIIDVIIRILKPKPGEIIQDPASGTGGFLIGAHRASRKSGKHATVTGMENVQDTYRLLLMNLYLHGIDDEAVYLGDALSEDYLNLLPPDVILTNPPFGPAGGRPTREDLTITANVTSYQLPFVEHCIAALKPGGRAAIVIPDNILFEGGRTLALRRLLMDNCDLHTVLRLPTGIFYAAGVRTNVLFFNKRTDDKPATKVAWFYDMRANMPAFGKTTPISESDFDAFVAAFGPNADGKSPRVDQGEAGRFRSFTREQISDRGDTLNISWLKDDSHDAEARLIEPDDIALAILGHLRTAVQQIEALSEEMENTTPREDA